MAPLSGSHKEAVKRFSGGVEQLQKRVHLALKYPGPPTKGGHGHGYVTVRRSPIPPHGGLGCDASHRGGVSAAGPAC